ncbi:site-specific integrase [Bacillus sp. EB01]|uniref:site-specific integrase n=1 Tax=Bacillus sp. EB01 TaxID=1347086 RepID=UPI000693C955|nr:site-specific integrase [Bacillus sp. EB01]
MEKHFESKIDRVFEWAKSKQITFIDSSNKPYKVNNSHATWKTYSDIMKTFEKWLQETHGLKDITRAKPRHGIEYMQQMIDKNIMKVKGGSAFTLSRFPHALHALQSIAKESGVYRGLKLGNKNDLIQMKNIAGIKRKSDESRCLKATSHDFEKVQNQIYLSKSPQKELIADIHQIQRGVGCRIHEVMKMKKEHITFSQDGTATVYIKGKGGLERWVRVDDKQTTALLKDRTEGKRGGAYVIQVKDREGNDKGRTNAIKHVQDIISAAAERAGVSRDGKTYSTHSARKVYAAERLKKYASLSYNQLNKELTNRIKTFPLDKNGQNKLKIKKDNELQQLRYKIDPKGTRYSKEKREHLRKRREFTHKELALFLVSIDTGHFRINIIRYYADYPDSKKKK